jgi:hypothetical protein
VEIVPDNKMASKISEQSSAPDILSSFLEMNVFKKRITSKAIYIKDLSPFPNTGMSVITFSTNLHIFFNISVHRNALGDSEEL